jgi:hypothetical protein
LAAVPREARVLTLLGCVELSSSDSSLISTSFLS